MMAKRHTVSRKVFIKSVGWFMRTEYHVAEGEVGYVKYRPIAVPQPNAALLMPVRQPIGLSLKAANAQA